MNKIKTAENTYIKKPTALVAAAKGFDLFCKNVYFIGTDKTCYEHIGLRNGTNILITAPPQWVLQKWLRDNHDIACEPLRTCYSDVGYTALVMHKGRQHYYSKEKIYKTYEQALEVSLRHGLKAIKKNKS